MTLAASSRKPTQSFLNERDCFGLFNEKFRNRKDFKIDIFSAVLCVPS